MAMLHSRRQLAMALRRGERRGPGATSSETRDALLRAIPDMMFVQSADGTYLDFHAPEPTKLYVQPEQFLGRRMDDIMPPDLCRKFHAAFADVLSTGRPAIVEYALPLADGVRHFEARIVDYDERHAVLSIVRDVTDRRASEEALRQAQADAANAAQLSWMGALAASMAHEINQPLAVIEANASAGLQWMTGPGASAREYVREILMDITAAAHRASAVIQRTLDLFSRQPAGRGPVHLHDLIDSALTTTAVALRRGAVAVSTNVPADLPPVHADRGMLLQVIISLISNATEAMHPVAGRAIFVDAGVTSDGVLQLHVEDTGPGIDPENLENVFKPFHTSKAGHIGIGLSISRAIIEAHGGALRAVRASKEGSGARFEITLPAMGTPRRARE